MDKKSERYLALPLGLSAVEVIALLGRPDLIVPRRGSEQWHYEGGRIVLTFTGAESHLTRIVRLLDGQGATTGDSDDSHAPGSQGGER